MCVCVCVCVYNIYVLICKFTSLVGSLSRKAFPWDSHVQLKYYPFHKFHVYNVYVCVCMCVSVHVCVCVRLGMGVCGVFSSSFSER